MLFSSFFTLFFVLKLGSRNGYYYLGPCQLRDKQNAYLLAGTGLCVTPLRSGLESHPPDSHRDYSLWSSDSDPLSEKEK